MNSILQTAVTDSVLDYEERPVAGLDTTANDVLPQDFVVPGPIYDYISTIGTVIIPSAQIRPNIPEVLVPHGPFEHESEMIDSDTFGTVDEDTNNAYEVNRSPYTTMWRVINSREVHPPEIWHPITP